MQFTHPQTGTALHAAQLHCATPFCTRPYIGPPKPFHVRGAWCVVRGASSLVSSVSTLEGIPLSPSHFLLLVCTPEVCSHLGTGVLLTDDQFCLSSLPRVGTGVSSALVRAPGLSSIVLRLTHSVCVDKSLPFLGPSSTSLPRLSAQLERTRLEWA